MLRVGAAALELRRSAQAAPSAAAALAAAEKIIANWESELRHFWQVVPREMLSRLQPPVTATGESELVDGLLSAGE